MQLPKYKKKILAHLSTRTAFANSFHLWRENLRLLTTSDLHWLTVSCKAAARILWFVHLDRHLYHHRKLNTSKWTEHLECFEGERESHHRAHPCLEKHGIGVAWHDNPVSSLFVSNRQAATSTPCHQATQVWSHLCISNSKIATEKCFKHFVERLQKLRCWRTNFLLIGKTLIAREGVPRSKNANTNALHTHPHRTQRPPLNIMIHPFMPQG